MARFFWAENSTDYLYFPYSCLMFSEHTHFLVPLLVTMVTTTMHEVFGLRLVLSFFPPRRETCASATCLSMVSGVVSLRGGFP